MEDGVVNADAMLDERFMDTEYAIPEVVENMAADEAVVARAGNGVIYHPGAKPPEIRSPGLEQRIKEMFDPKGVLPE